MWYLCVRGEGTHASHCLCFQDLYPSLWHIFCVHSWCLACAGKVCRICYMKDEFHLLRSVNSEPVLRRSGSRGERICFMQDFLLLKLICKECRMRVVWLMLTCSLWLPRYIDFKYCGYFWDTKRQFMQRFIFFPELRECMWTERADHYTQVCCVWRSAAEKLEFGSWRALYNIGSSGAGVVWTWFQLIRDSWFWHCDAVLLRDSRNSLQHRI